MRPRSLSQATGVMLFSRRVSGFPSTSANEKDDDVTQLLISAQPAALNNNNDDAPLPTLETGV